MGYEVNNDNVDTIGLEVGKALRTLMKYKKMAASDKDAGKTDSLTGRFQEDYKNLKELNTTDQSSQKLTNISQAEPALVQQVAEAIAAAKEKSGLKDQFIAAVEKGAGTKVRKIGTWNSNRSKGAIDIVNALMANKTNLPEKTYAPARAVLNSLAGIKMQSASAIRAENTVNNSSSEPAYDSNSDRGSPAWIGRDVSQDAKRNAELGLYDLNVSNELGESVFTEESIGSITFIEAGRADTDTNVRNETDVDAGIAGIYAPATLTDVAKQKINGSSNLFINPTGEPNKYQILLRGHDGTEQVLVASAKISEENLNSLVSEADGNRVTLEYNNGNLELTSKTYADGSRLTDTFEPGDAEGENGKINEKINGYKTRTVSVGAPIQDPGVIYTTAAIEQPKFQLDEGRNIALIRGVSTILKYHKGFEKLHPGLRADLLVATKVGGDLSQISIQSRLASFTVKSDGAIPTLEAANFKSRDFGGFSVALIRDKSGNEIAGDNGTLAYTILKDGREIPACCDKNPLFMTPDQFEGLRMSLNENSMSFDFTVEGREIKELTPGLGGIIDLNAKLGEIMEKERQDAAQAEAGKAAQALPPKPPKRAPPPVPTAKNAITFPINVKIKFKSRKVGGDKEVDGEINQAGNDYRLSYKSTTSGTDNLREFKISSGVFGQITDLAGQTLEGVTWHRGRAGVKAKIADQVFTFHMIAPTPPLEPRPPVEVVTVERVPAYNAETVPPLPDKGKKNQPEPGHTKPARPKPSPAVAAADQLVAMENVLGDDGKLDPEKVADKLIKVTKDVTFEVDRTVSGVAITAGNVVNGYLPIEIKGNDNVKDFGESKATIFLNMATGNVHVRDRGKIVENPLNKEGAIEGHIAAGLVGGRGDATHITKSVTEAITSTLKEIRDKMAQEQQEIKESGQSLA